MPAPDSDVSDDRRDLDLVTAAAGEASAIAMGYFRRDPQVWLKEKASPVSEADYAVDAYLRETLCAARPDYGWLSEETEDDVRRMDRRRLFVVDPIDGTRGFLAGSEEWTISLAVVEDGRPVVAALVQPATGVLYTAVRGAGARRDGSPLGVGPAAAGRALVAAGPSALVSRLASGIDVPVDRGGYVASLALRIAMVADGRLDLALAKADARDWDLAAADLILSEAGGVLLAPGAARPWYNRSDTRHPVLVAAEEGLARRIVVAVAPAAADIGT